MWVIPTMSNIMRQSTHHYCSIICSVVSAGVPQPGKAHSVRMQSTAVCCRQAVCALIGGWSSTHLAANHTNLESAEGAGLSKLDEALSSHSHTLPSPPRMASLPSRIASTLRHGNDAQRFLQDLI
jgi:hypothetical protein